MAPVQFYLHPFFIEQQAKWQKYHDLYEGDHDVLVSTKYLVPHEKESSVQEAGKGPDGMPWTVGQKLRALRASRSWYLNLFEPIVSNWVSMAFSKPISIPEPVKEMFGEEELADVDGEGNSLENFVKTVFAPAYFRDGRPYLLADAPTGEFKNLAEQQQSGFRPYLELLDVLSVKDWQVGRDNKFDWLRHEYTAIAPRSGPDKKPEEECFSRTLILENSTFVQKIFKKVGEAWELVEEIPVPGWTELPVSAILHNDPWVKDVAELQIALFNTMSGWFNVINTQGFERVILAGPLGDKHKISVSEYTWSVVPENTNVTVIPPADLSSDERAMNWLVNQMYRVAFNRTRGLSEASMESPGADTLREMNAELISVLKVSLTEMQNCLNRAIEFYARFKGKADFKSEVVFNTDLSVEDVEKAAQRFLTYRDEIRKVLSWRKAHLKKVALAEGFSEKEQKEIEADIDKLKDEPPVNPLAGMRPFMNGGQGQQGNEEEVEGSGDQGGEGSGRPGGRAGSGDRAIPSKESDADS